MAKNEDFQWDSGSTYRVGDTAFYLEFTKKEGFELNIKPFSLETEYKLYKEFTKEQGGKRVIARYMTSPRPGKREEKEFDELIRVLKRENIDYKIVKK